MSTSIGKRFEDNWKLSLPKDVLYHRLKDSAQSFDKNKKNSKLRFSLKNPCDCFMFYSPYFFTLELKSVGTTSISFEREKPKSNNDKKTIHYHQIEGLRKFSKYNNTISGFLFNFRHKDSTETLYFQRIEDFDQMITDINKKSFNEKDLIEHNPIILESRKLKVNYRYNVEKFISDVTKGDLNIEKI